MAKSAKIKNVDRKDAKGYARRAVDKYIDAVTLNDAGGAKHSIEQLLVMACIHACDAICISALGQKSQGDEHNQATKLLEKVERAKDLAPKLQTALRMKNTDQYSVNELSASDLTRLFRITDAMVARSAEICGINLS